MHYLNAPKFGQYVVHWNFRTKIKNPLCDNNVNELMFASWRISYPVVDKKLFFFLEPLIRPHILDLVNYHKLKIDLESGPSQRKKKEWIFRNVTAYTWSVSIPCRASSSTWTLERNWLFQSHNENTGYLSHAMLQKFYIYEFTKLYLEQK